MLKELGRRERRLVMGEFSARRKIFSFGCMIVGVAMMIAGLYMAITLTDFWGVRGTLIIAGCVAFFVGLYFFPTFKHHRVIINFMFLFPAKNLLLI